MMIHRYALSCLFLLIASFPLSVHAFLVNEWQPIDTMTGEAPEAEPARPGRNWTEPYSEMSFVWIPGGCFKMGSPPRIEGRDADEGPVHDSCLSGFWMGRYEVTQGQWQRVMRHNPANFRKGEEYPVERVSWEDAESFVRKMNARYPGIYRFRLPTEAEWEYVCRNLGKRVRYAGGGDPDSMSWYAGNSGNFTQPVGTRTPNVLGVGDLSGNVWEWVVDAYEKDGYQTHKRNNPVVEKPSVYRALRGGGWVSPQKSLRCANRGFEHFTTRRTDIGLRLVRVLHGQEDKPPSDRITDIRMIP
ncbi:MAG: formylglycine-generating enzyme family protein [Magnetococcales bacterium]|nr:formylglycine-generating enzyme family protein [Magnetococcales bacterium]